MRSVANRRVAGKASSVLSTDRVKGRYCGEKGNAESCTIMLKDEGVLRARDDGAMMLCEGALVASSLPIHTRSGSDAHRS